MGFFVETLKNASFHIHSVWNAIAYVAVILAMTVDFIAGLRKAANTFHVIVKDKDDIAAIIIQVIEIMGKKQKNRKVAVGQVHQRR